MSSLKQNGVSFIASAFMILISSLLVACFDDNFDRAMKIETLPLDIIVLEKNKPVPGGDGILTNNLVTDTSIQVLWSPATDVETPQDQLEYCLYRSTSNNISTISDVFKNGVLVHTWQPGMVTDIVNGLEAGTTYFFNVVVRDGDGLMAAYRIVSITTLADAIFMFPAGQYQGNIVASGPVRAGIDALCMDSRLRGYPALPCLNVRAFISIDSSDDIAGMPGNYGIPTDRKIVGPEKIVGPDGEISYPSVALDWADLLDGSIGMNLEDAVITSKQWWSGSLSDGTFDASADCNGWTSTDPKGASGKFNRTDDQWITGNSPNCSDRQMVLCVCW
jgi:hypothetical protein